MDPFVNAIGKPEKYKATEWFRAIKLHLSIMINEGIEEIFDDKCPFCSYIYHKKLLLNNDKSLLKNKGKK
jgi:hypothetical protein